MGSINPLSETRFYTYAYFRPDGSPLYLGKGQTKRMWEHLRLAEKIVAGDRWPIRSNKKLIRTIIAAWDGGFAIPVIKIQVGLTAVEAIRNEIALIAAIGRECDGGPLVNLTAGGEGQLRRPMSDATKRKIGLANTGRTKTPEARQRLSESMKGRKKPEGFGAKIAAARRGIPHSDQRKKNISLARTGYKLTEEQRRRRRECMSRPDVRERLRVANLGKKASEDTRRKMSAAKLGKKRASK